MEAYDTRRQYIVPAFAALRFFDERNNEDINLR